MSDQEQKKQGLIRYQNGEWSVENIHFEGCGVRIKAGKLVSIVGYKVDDENSAAITVEFIEHPPQEGTTS